MSLTFLAAGSQTVSGQDKERNKLILLLQYYYVVISSVRDLLHGILLVLKFVRLEITGIRMSACDYLHVHLHYIDVGKFACNII